MSKAKTNRTEAAEPASPKQRAAKPATAPVAIIIGKSKQKASTTPTIAEPTSKLDVIVTLLKRPKGATMDEMMQATGWQRHSVHGTLSGTIKKKRGLPLITEFGERGRIYKIAA